MEQLTPIEPKNARERELRDRAVRDYAALQAVGLETGRTFFPPGTEAHVALSTGRISQARRDFERLPEATEALAKLADAVVAEDRQDLTVRFGGFAHEAPGYARIDLTPGDLWITFRWLGEKPGAAPARFRIPR